MVLIKYSGKYVKIYFNMKITFLHLYRSRVQVGNGFTPSVCLSVCIWMITFEPLDLLTSFVACK